ncbi:uncharacterized protein LOC108153381 [Drosophila miranda]|uniref:uncharacterized protein LOC108153381 n=1 Tax=Drosophila miranda TaxID=7229 RepID=UPI0007E6785C|nr:uncharacterized protein LOC108153381 [Drosophila miranda]
MLLNLPLEIIDKVFGYLNEKEQVKAAQVHQQLGRAFAYHVGGNYKRLNCCHFVGGTSVLRYTYDEFRVILSLCGSTVVDISIKSSDVTDRIGELIEKYCINLESAFIVVTDGNFNAIKRILGMKGIQKLGLNSNRYRGSDLLQHINPNCKRLCLIGNTPDQKDHLRQLTNLEKLDVESVEFQNIFEICSHLKKLRKLMVSGLRKTSQKLDFLYPELEELSLRYFYIKQEFPTCPKLKTLRLFYSVCLTESVAQLILKYANTLESLILIPKDYEHEFYAKDLIIVLRNCKSLQFLDTKNGILKSIFSELLESFIQVLKENGFSTQKRFKLVGDLDKTDELKQELMNKLPNSEVWDLITLTDIKIYCK